MYKKVPTGLNFAEREQEILDFWRENKIFEKSIEHREGAPIFTFYDGPPTANGLPHIGHVLTRAVKDLIPRYKTMKGYRVLRKAGWDTHGLPVELEVEKELGISGKPDIEKFGIEPFIQKCKESVWKYENLWREMSERVAFWADMDSPYVTYHNDFIESVWWALSQIYSKDLIYKSYRVVPYCPRCGTPLSSHEVAQGYKDVTEDSAYVAFKVADKENEYLLAWTTTPWTLPSNIGLCVNAKEEYARVRHGDKVYIMAKALVSQVMGEECEILEAFTGKDLEGTKYEPLFDFAANSETDVSNGFTVVCDPYVTLTSGTGIVHIAPAFGEDDARISKAYDLPLLQFVDAQGCFTDEVYLWKGLFVKDADPLILKELKIRGQLFKKLKYEHSYPFCWRCDTPLLYYARDAWFIRVSSLRDKLMASNNDVNWLPDHMKEGRFGNFIENVIDWSLSRERYWGTPLPIWICEDENCGHRHCVGSIAELKEMGENVPDNIELHKPYIDEVKLKCPKCSSKMHRTPEVIDCWFDAGAMPFAQWHYPFENKELFDNQFPADFISEAIDQTRGWFYTLMAISTMLFEKSSYKNVIVLGHVLDAEGKKMSKSKGNAVSPMDALTKHGADAVRWYFYINSAPWFSSRYSDELVLEGARRFMGTLWNTYAFYVLYADIDKFNPYVPNHSEGFDSRDNANVQRDVAVLHGETAFPQTLMSSSEAKISEWEHNYEYETKELSVMDNWLNSRLNTLITKVDEAMEAYEITEPARLLDQFADELSNWYLRRSRERFWGSEMTQDKINAYKTLHHALVTVAKLAAPFVPFISEQIYQNLVVGVSGAGSSNPHRSLCSLAGRPAAQPQRPLRGMCPISVHLCDFPVADNFRINPQLEAQMANTIEIVTQGRAARNAGNAKTRQPLSEMMVALPSTDTPPDASLLEVIREELNVKTVTFISDGSDYVGYNIKPQLRTLGPRYGKLVPKIAAALNESPDQTMQALKQGTWEVTIDDTVIALTMDDVLVETTQKEGFATASDKGITVVLNTNLTPELIEEGNMRELVSKWQNMRREADYNVTDRILAGYSDNTILSQVIENNHASISAELMADKLTCAPPPQGAFVKEWNVNGETIELWVKQEPKLL